MKTRTFGRLGWAVSEVDYGMWGMGGWSGSDDAESLASLDRAAALGCNFFDTAYVYGEGRSERLLGETLRRHKGARLYVATKVPPKNRRWPGRAETPPADAFPYEHVVEMTRRSAGNLDVERIDPASEPIGRDDVHVWCLRVLGRRAGRRVESSLNLFARRSIGSGSCSLSNNGPFTEDGDRYEGDIAGNALRVVGPADLHYELDANGDIKKSHDGTVTIGWWLRNDEGRSRRG